MIRTMSYIDILLSEKKLRKLSPKQAYALSSIITSRAACASGSAIPLNNQSLGGVMSALQRNNYIAPLGFDPEKRQYRWEVVDEDMKKDKEKNPDSLNMLLRKIAEPLYAKK